MKGKLFSEVQRWGKWKWTNDKLNCREFEVSWFSFSVTFMRLDLFGVGACIVVRTGRQWKNLRAEIRQRKRECCKKLRETWKDSGVDKIVFPDDFPWQLRDCLVLRFRASVCSDRGGSGPDTCRRVPAGAALDQTRDRPSRLTRTGP